MRLSRHTGRGIVHRPCAIRVYVHVLYALGTSENRQKKLVFNSRVENFKAKRTGTSTQWNRNNLNSRKIPAQPSVVFRSRRQNFSKSKTLSTNNNQHEQIRFDGKYDFYETHALRTFILYINRTWMKSYTKLVVFSYSFFFFLYKSRYISPNFKFTRHGKYLYFLNINLKWELKETKFLVILFTQKTHFIRKPFQDTI